jgi:hypothetical protein
MVMTRKDITVGDAAIAVAMAAAQIVTADAASLEEDVTLERDLIIIVAAEDAILPDLTRLTPDHAVRRVTIKSHIPVHAKNTRSPVPDLSHPERW